MQNTMNIVTENLFENDPQWLFRIFFSFSSIFWMFNHNFLFSRWVCIPLINELNLSGIFASSQPPMNMRLNSCDDGQAPVWLQDIDGVTSMTYGFSCDELLRREFGFNGRVWSREHGLKSLPSIHFLDYIKNFSFDEWNNSGSYGAEWAQSIVVLVQFIRKTRSRCERNGGHNFMVISADKSPLQFFHSIFETANLTK
jgi:hypothetical protein